MSITTHTEEPPQDAQSKIESLCQETIGENGKGVYDLAELTELLVNERSTAHKQGADVERERVFKDVEERLWTLPRGKITAYGKDKFLSENPEWHKYNLAISDALNLVKKMATEPIVQTPEYTDTTAKSSEGVTHR